MDRAALCGARQLYEFFDNCVEVNSKPHFLIRKGYYIVPSPSISLV